MQYILYRCQLNPFSEEKIKEKTAFFVLIIFAYLWIPIDKFFVCTMHHKITHVILISLYKNIFLFMPKGDVEWWWLVIPSSISVVTLVDTINSRWAIKNLIWRKLREIFYCSLLFKGVQRCRVARVNDICNKSCTTSRHPLTVQYWRWCDDTILWGNPSRR